TVVALGELGGATASEAMLPALRDPSSEVRYHAAVSLGHLAAPGTLSALAILLEDEDPFVVRGLVRATAQFQGAKAVALRASAEERLKALEAARREREPSAVEAETSSAGGSSRFHALSRAFSNPRVAAGSIVALLLLSGGLWFWPVRKPTASATSTELSQAGSARRSDHLVGVGIAAEGSAVVVTQSGRVELWDSTTGELRKNVGGTPEPVSAAAVSAQGTLVALAEPLGRLRVLNLPDGTERLALAMRPGVVSRMRFSDDGTRLVCVAADGVVKLLDLKTQKWDEEVTIEGFAELQAWALDGDLKRVALVRRNGDVLVQQLAPGRRAARVPVRTEGPVTAVAFGSDRKVLAVVDVTHTLRLYDLAAKQVRKELRGGGPGTVRLVFSADGKRVAGGGAEGITFWDLEAESGSVVSAELQVDKRREFLELVDLLSLDESGRWLIGGSTSGPHALVWNAQSRRMSSSLSVN
ncbi:MAG: HEAT repeat domain-containing protein, partial [Planctomycetaceae bacterium]